MSIEGWYYLHENGELIYKRELGGTAADIRESDLATSMWPFDPTDRAGAWRILVEALALEAKQERVEQLAKLWGCDDNDAAIYADHIGVNLSMDGNAWYATTHGSVDLQSSPSGFGGSCLEAMAALCRDLGFKGGKMWNATFADLCEGKAA